MMPREPKYVCKVHIRDLVVIADIGVHHHEIGRPQEIVVSVDIDTAIPEADRVECALDYRFVATRAEELARDRIGLIETFALRLANFVMEHPSAQSVEVRVDKPRALESGVAGASVLLRNAEPS